MQSDNIINVSFKEFFWSVLEQWKLMLLVGVAFALLFPFLLSQKEKKAASERISAEAQYAGLSREEKLDQLDDASRQAVITAAYQANVISSMDNYNANSLLSHIDLNNARTFHMKLLIADTDKAAALAASYGALLSDSDTIAMIGQGMGDSFNGIEEAYIRELVRTEADDNSVDLYVFVPQGADEDGLEKAITERLHSINVTLAGMVGDHRLVTLAMETVYTSNPDMMGQILARNNDLQLLRETYEASLLTFSDLQTNILNSLISGSDDKAELSGSQTSSPVFTKGRVVIGFVLGIFIYVFVLLMYTLFNSKLQSGEHLDTTYNVRLLGKSSKYGYTGIKRFIHSKFVYNIHNKAYQDDKTADRIAASVIQSCKHNNVSRLSLIVIGDIKDKKRVDLFADKLRKENGLSVKLLNGVVEDKSLENTDAVVFLVGQNVTNHKDIRNTLGLCSSYDRKVIGGICLI